MAVSQNGYPVLDRGQCVVYTVGGHPVPLAPGAPGEMLAHAGNWFDANIRDITPGPLDEWGWAARNIRGSSTVISNHYSGTALDVDATKWPLGVLPSRYLTAAEIARWRSHLTLYEGCLRWGGDYVGRKDPMHTEINRDRATVERVWAKIKGGGLVVGPPVVGAGVRTLKLVVPHMKGDDVRAVQAKLKRVYPAYAGRLVVDGDFGPATEAAVREFQRRSGLMADGIVGANTRRALGL